MSLLSQAAEIAKGERLKREALALLATRRAVFVRLARRELLRLLIQQKTATADDLRDRLAVPAKINPKVIGTVFSGLADLGLITQVSYEKSRRSVARRRPIGRWELVDPNGALDWLRDNPELQEPAEPAEDSALLLGDFSI